MEKDLNENHPFSQYYAMLIHQQNMLQDYIRTGTYERAMMENKNDFYNKIVLDVGTGTGILAYFAIQAGAKHVYAVELSNMAYYAKRLMEDNNLSNKITIIKGKIEDIELPEKIDIIVSEPMGFLLVHERMLEPYIISRIKWLKSKNDYNHTISENYFRPFMFPSVGNIYFCPFSDEIIYKEQMKKSDFWCQTNFYGLNLRSMKEDGMKNHFSQAIVGSFSSNILICQKPIYHTIDFQSIELDELKHFEVSFQFKIERTCIMHGFGCWFSVDFNGSVSKITLSTGPSDPSTHWYQCRLLLLTPIAINMNQSISGIFRFNVNDKYSYDIDIHVSLDGTDITSYNKVFLHNQMYNYLQQTDL